MSVINKKSASVIVITNVRIVYLFVLKYKIQHNPVQKFYARPTPTSTSHRIMGFTAYLSTTMDICTETGKSYYIRNIKNEDGTLNRIEKCFSLPPDIPVEFRKFITLTAWNWRIILRIYEHDTAENHHICVSDCHTLYDEYMEAYEEHTTDTDAHSPMSQDEFDEWLVFVNWSVNTAGVYHTYVY